MHVRVTTRRRGTKSYRSVQLVHSFRRPDGMPAHKVLATLGNLSEVQTENLRRAIAASRQSQLVVLPDAPVKPPRVAHNLAYLDVALCYRLWQSWRLSSLIDDLVPPGARQVSVGAIIAALTIQRCVAPASKLEASRWYRRTALPELQGLSPTSCNNTRIHRALECLDDIEAPLQQALGRRINEQAGGFVSLFLDCSDTWFVGRGPELARQRITKEGLRRRRIGIALLCDQRGLPLRWATLPGNHYEARSMMAILDEVQQLPWARALPLVVDRGMGHGVTIEQMLARQVQCVTAVPAPELPGYSSRIPLGDFDDVAPGDADRRDGQALTALRQRARQLGFAEVSPRRYVLDLGVITKGEGAAPAVNQQLAPSRAVAALLVGRLVDAERRQRTPWRELTERYQCAQPQLRSWRRLVELTPELQARIEAGAADRVTPKTLRHIAAAPPAAQAVAFEAACQEARERSVLRASRVLARVFGVPALQVRAAVLFNPEAFIEERQAAQDTLERLDRVVAQVNGGLQSPQSRRSRESAVGAIRTALGRWELLDAFRIEVSEVMSAGRLVPQLHLVRDEEAWQRRRRTDGLNLIVAHPEVAGTAAELAALYFAKDQVEKDFQAIKSVLALRPVHHRTTEKVRAHVSLCMLALLLERTLEQRLRDSGVPMSADSALRKLQPVHLNRFATNPPIYSVTALEPEQRRILSALHEQELADDDAVTGALTPR